jgi:hypothetical protein
MQREAPRTEMVLEISKKRKVVFQMNVVLVVIDDCERRETSGPSGSSLCGEPRETTGGLMGRVKEFSENLPCCGIT